MRVRVPPKRVQEKFYIIYELEGCQKAVNFLCKHYGTKRMRVVLSGKKLGRNCEAFHYEGKAYFSKRSLKKRNVLHEFFHFLIESKGLELPERMEEKQANSYAREFVKKP